MSDRIAAREAINEARACIWNAAKIAGGARALEGDLESAYSRLEEARDALDLDDVAYAQRAVAEALELLRTEESRLIAEDIAALEHAIRLVSQMSWS
jgi:hypothetical protein